jgi:phosphoglycolate phosphatase
LKTLLFDLDGTLSDPLLGIARSINHALSECGYNQRDEQHLAQYVGPPLDETFKILTGEPEEGIRRLVAVYRERYAEVGYSENTIYPEVPSVLHSLKTQGVRMGVCTSKRSDFAEKILRMFGIRNYFAFVSGGDIGITKQQQIAQLLDEQLIDQKSWMIGDRSVDVTAAHQNGLMAAGVLWGYGSRKELEAAKPTLLLTHVSELIQLALR